MLEYARYLIDNFKANIWNYGGDAVGFSAVIAVIGTTLNNWLGGFDGILVLLCAFMVVDFITGILAAIKTKTVSSNAMLWGGVNKLLVLIVVAMGVLLDGVFSFDSPYIRTAFIWFYISREVLSFAENYKKMGKELPPILDDILAQINGMANKNDKKGDEENRKD